MRHPLYVAIIWHMHQPYYKNLVTGEHILPWVRLHAIRDYLHMLEVLQPFPQMRATINFVPCLVEQLIDYGEHGAEDRYLRLTLAPLASLTNDDKRFMLESFFAIDHHVIRQHPRYGQLFDLATITKQDQALLGDGFWQDLRAWFNLAWIDPNWMERHPELRRLVEQGRDFTDADLRCIISIQHEMMRRIIPLARELVQRGQLECTTTPYYHPISPLLIDTRSALEAVPQLPLPRTRYEHPEDAAEQIRLAIEAHRSYFGQPPAGFWPAEGSVSDALIGLLAQQPSIRWLATDEAILAESRGRWIERDGYGHVNNPGLLYQPYAVQPLTTSWNGRKPLAMVFRDHHLSDRIGFVYQSWNGIDAANDLHHRLRVIAERLAAPDVPHLVTVILDGENCWGSYEHNGDVFLRRLYGLLSEHETIQPTTVASYLDRFEPRVALDRVRAGSWINGDFRVWIGEPPQNDAWVLLKQTRDRLVAWQRQAPLADMDVLEAAWREIYIAEGSDWFWWYYSNNSSPQDALFDAEFRGHLANVYRLVGLPIPPILFRPIRKAERPGDGRRITGMVAPSIDGGELAGREWAAAGRLEAAVSGGTMLRTKGVFASVYYGYNPQTIVFRIETNVPTIGLRFAVYLATPSGSRLNNRIRFAETNAEIGQVDVPLGWEVAVEPPIRHASLSQADGHEQWLPIENSIVTGMGESVVEVAIPVGPLQIAPGDTVRFVVAASRGGILAEALPTEGVAEFTFDVPE